RVRGKKGMGAQEKEHHTPGQALPEGQVPAGDRPPGTHPEVQGGQGGGREDEEGKGEEVPGVRARGGQDGLQRQQLQRVCLPWRRQQPVCGPGSHCEEEEEED
ncbi:hypothetical protein THAOC_25988, partial [Thalassiosira oceanica]